MSENSREIIKPEMKRYSLALPVNTWNEMEEVCKKRHMTIADFIRRSTKLGIMVENGATLIEEKNGKRTELLFL